MTAPLPAVAVLLEAGATSTFAIAAAARDLCRLVWAVDLSDPTVAPEQRALARFGTVVDLAGRRGQDVAAELRSLDVGGVTVFTDPPIPYAAALGEALGVPFHSPETARLCVDKAAQRARLAEHGVPSAAYVAVPAGSPVPQGFPTPAVVKPRRGAATRGVVYAADEQAVRAAVAAAGEDVLVEEFLPDLTPRAQQSRRADLVSVECFFRGGEPTLVGVTGRWPLGWPFQDAGGYVPSDLPAEEQDAVVEVAFAAARALGVRHGFLHVEVKRTPAGPRIVEVNGRLGGVVPGLHLNAGGTDLVRASLELALDLDVAPPAPLSRVGYMLAVPAPDGVDVVGEICGLDRVRELPGVTDVRINLAPGSTVDRASGNGAHVVAVEGTAPDHATASGLRAGALRAITVR